MTKRDRDRLSHVRPELADAVAKALKALEALGHPMGVTDGLRTTAQQQALWAKGRTAPGRIVTQIDGVLQLRMNLLPIQKKQNTSLSILEVHRSP